MSFSRFSAARAIRVFTLALGFTGILTAPLFTAQADPLEQMIKMNRIEYTTPIRVLQDTQIKLHNDWDISLHGTTISQIESGLRLAKIDTIAVGQTVTLEFPKEGGYSICYFLRPQQTETENRCFLLNVVPMKAA